MLNAFTSEGERFERYEVLLDIQVDVSAVHPWQLKDVRPASRSCTVYASIALLPAPELQIHACQDARPFALSLRAAYMEHSLVDRQQSQVTLTLSQSP
eukprot:CAMPEP_0185034024 /NCGR_PEP_ID=MMETSP1103-20130426/23521_1 /TAXON_ID=36769 /ORGANISM="Paraphysomonas bandaiensis, Strain Caron Lab Isolate" /LENGTH=97 /DNA_ID=CAMNT_0027570507 /DNA_START=220 /DNA_END=508 /DNA_ORIENTATION=+